MSKRVLNATLFFTALALIFPLANVCAENFPIPISDYVATEAGQDLTLFGILKHRIKVSPFNLVSTVLFFCAIIHTFFAPKLMKMAKKISESSPGGEIRFKTAILHYLGEVEVIFGLWTLPLLVAIFYFFGWHAVTSYFNRTVSFAEPIFVVAVMAIAATKPVLSLAEYFLEKIAKLAGGTVGAWWMTILIVAPFMGSFITEPAAITIAAILLSKQFYDLQPSTKLRYATIGLLFVNISVGGTLTHFAAPPILMVAHKWGLTSAKVFDMLGQHAIVGVIFATCLYYIIFRKEFFKLNEGRKSITEPTEEKHAIPWSITAVHCLFLAWTVVNLHTPSLVVIGFLFFLAFTKTTSEYQNIVDLRAPVLVGFFLAGLVIHGGLQEWWISPILGKLTTLPLFIGSTILTAFNDNASITYLASLVSEFSYNQLLQKAVLAGAVTGGGLTIIANAPNPAGQNVLSKYFPHGISPLYLFFAALPPTLVVAICFHLW